MFCPKCAAENPNEAQFCGECGNALPQMGAADASAESSTPPTPAAGRPTASGGTGQAGSASNDSKKIVVGLVAIFLGWLGIHKFLLGYNTPGIILLVLGLLGFVTLGLTSFAAGIVGLIEGIIYLTKSDEEFKQTYVDNQKPWF